MKSKVFFLIAILMMAMVGQPAYAAKKKTKKKMKPELTRVGNTYFAGNEKMKRMQMEEWYAKQNCEQARDQFKKGNQMFMAGWTLMAFGTAFEIIGLGCTFGWVGKSVDRVVDDITDTASGKPTSKRSEKISPKDPMLLAGASFMAIGLPCVIACGPLTKVGKKKMYGSVDVYNVTCRKRAWVQPTWSVQSSQNGLGMAINF